jgi:hypothetical protein
VALSSQLHRSPWYVRLPHPIQFAALRAWGLLPTPIRRTLVPLGSLFGTHTTSAIEVPGPNSVPGVTALRGDGFEPVEELTGALWIAEVWPEQHRRSVAETRTEWLDDNRDGRLWLVRSPWAALSADDVFTMLWPWALDRTLDEQIMRSRATELLRWDEARAIAWQREVADKFGDE